MAEQDNEDIKTSENQVVRDKLGRVISGTPNPEGRPKGQRNYATIYREALRKIAESKDMTPDELEDMLAETGLMSALKGDYQFYRDIQDRIHGKPVNYTDITSKGQQINKIEVEFINAEQDNNEDTPSE